MPIEMVTVPPAPTAETIIDRSSGRSWTVDVVPFEIATTVVTVEQWHAAHGEPVPEAGAHLPQVEVSWRDAVSFCNTLSQRAGLTSVYAITQVEATAPDGWRPHDQPLPDDWVVEWDRTASGYRLPTEAEWQVACRAGTSGPHYDDLDEIAWYAANSGGQLPEVAQKRPNSWGLFDALGGVWEWCWDLYDEERYGAYRIIRGGGWNDPPWSCRAGVRRKTNPQTGFDDLGFRLARNAGA